MTAKQLEQETGCKIMVRGRGSMRDKLRRMDNNGVRFVDGVPFQPCIEHLNDPLHVLISCEDYENRARVKLDHAVAEVRKLLVPAVSPTSFD